MILLSPFSNISIEEIKRYFIIEKYLSERNLECKYSKKQRIYYNLLRPFIPLKFRHKIQKYISSSIKCQKYFINEDFINFLYLNIGMIEFPEDLYPERKKTAIILTHDVEGELGLKSIPQVIKVEQKYNLYSSWNIVPYKYRMDEGILRFIVETKNEIGIHGYNHDGKLFSSYKEFHSRIPAINAAIKKYNALGFRSPMMHRNLVWQQELDILYDSSTFDYDPYQPFPGGIGYIWPFIAGKFVEMPYTLPQDHTLFYELKENSIEIWKKKINWIIKNKGMVLVLTHPDYLIENQHLKYYEQLLDYLNQISDAWYCLPNEMAYWWKERSKTNQDKTQQNLVPA